MKNFKSLIVSVLCFQLGLAPLATAFANTATTSVSCESRVQDVQQRILKTAQIMLAGEKEKILNEYANQSNITPEAKEKTKSKLARLNEWLQNLSSIKQLGFNIGLSYLVFKVAMTAVDFFNSSDELMAKGYLAFDLSETSLITLDQNIDRLKKLESEISDNRNILSAKMAALQRNIGNLDKLYAQKETLMIKYKKDFNYIKQDQTLKEMADLVAKKAKILRNSEQENLILSQKIKNQVQESKTILSQMKVSGFINDPKIARQKSAIPLIKYAHAFDQTMTQFITSQAEVNHARYVLAKAIENDKNAIDIKILEEKLNKAIHTNDQLRGNLLRHIEQARKIKTTLTRRFTGSAILLAGLIISATSGIVYLMNDHLKSAKEQPSDTDLSHSEKLSLKKQDRLDQISFLAMLSNPETQEAACNAYDQSPEAMNLYEKNAIKALLTEMLMDIRKR